MKSQKGVSSLAGTIILAVILAIAAGVLLYSNSLLEEKTNPPQINLQKTAVQGNETAGLAPSGVEGWKTYTNTKYGFEFSYPSTSSIDEGPNEYGIISLFVDDKAKKVDSSNSLSFLSPRQFEVSIYPKDSVESQYNFELSNGVVQGSISNTKIDGKDAVILKAVWNYEGNSYYGYNVLIKYNSLLYTLSYWMDNQKLNNTGNYTASQQILSTFKFTK